MEIRLLDRAPWSNTPAQAVLDEHEMPAINSLWQRTSDKIRIVGVDAARGEVWFEVVGKEELVEDDLTSGWSHAIPAAEFNRLRLERGWQEITQ